MRYMEEWVAERKIDEIECLVADLSGIPRGKILPASKFLKIVRENGLRLPESIFIQTVTGEYSENADYEDIATCPSCSLIIRVIYDPVRGLSVLCSWNGS